MALRRTAVAQACKSPLKPTRSSLAYVTPMSTPPPSPSNLSLSGSGCSTPTPLCLTPKFKSDMGMFLSKEHQNYTATQFTEDTESNAVWSEPLPKFPSWKTAFTYDLDAPAAAHNAVTTPTNSLPGTPRPASKKAAAQPIPVESPFKAFGAQLQGAMAETFSEATSGRQLRMKKDDFTQLRSMVKSSTIVKVPVAGAFGYDAAVDEALLPSEQFALRVACQFLGAASPAALMRDLSDLQQDTLKKGAKKPIMTANQKGLFRYLQLATSTSEEIALHNVVRIIAAAPEDFDQSDFLHMTLKEELTEAKLVYLDLSNADAYLRSLRSAMPKDAELATCVYREFLAAPLRLKERWNQTDFVVVPVYQGMNEPRVMGILKTTTTGRMKIENTWEFKDLAVAALRDYYAAQPEGARREEDGVQAVAELKAVAEITAVTANMLDTIDVDSVLEDMAATAKVQTRKVAAVSGFSPSVMKALQEQEEIHRSIGISSAKMEKPLLQAAAKKAAELEEIHRSIGISSANMEKRLLQAAAKKAAAPRSISPSKIVESFLADAAVVKKAASPTPRAVSPALMAIRNIAKTLKTPTKPAARVVDAGAALSKPALTGFSKMVGSLNEFLDDVEVLWL